MGFAPSHMNGGQYANTTTCKIEIKSNSRRWRIAANASQFPKREIKWIVFGA